MFELENELKTPETLELRTGMRMLMNFSDGKHVVVIMLNTINGNIIVCDKMWMPLYLKKKSSSYDKILLNDMKDYHEVIEVYSPSSNMGFAEGLRPTDMHKSHQTVYKKELKLSNDAKLYALRELRSKLTNTIEGPYSLCILNNETEALMTGHKQYIKSIINQEQDSMGADTGAYLWDAHNKEIRIEFINRHIGALV